MIEALKQLREETGASIGQIRAALAESGDNIERARDILKTKLGAIADKKASREVKAGLVDAYIHQNGRIGAMIELQCETDFVARNPKFKELAHDLALHIAAMAPQDRTELEEQEFVRDPSRRIGELVKEAIGTFGENIQIGNFTRFEL